MAAPPAELVSQIVELKDEFQHFAVNHPWICLYIPSAENENFFLGERAASRYSLNEISFPHSVTGRDIRVRIAIGVDTPRDPDRKAVVDHVKNLTFRAEDLLKRVLEYDSQIVPQARQEIREWEQQRMGFGWVRFLRYATVIQGNWRVENYPQRAATALFELKEYCRASVGTDDTFLFAGRLRFDETTHTVHLDGNAYSIDEPKAFALYRLLADQKGVPITRQEIRIKNRQLRGDKTVSRMRVKLPRNLKNTVKSSNAGYWLHLPPKK